MRAKYWVCTHNFNVNIPKSVQEAKEFDEENRNTLWWYAICKGMKNTISAFEVWKNDIS